jgi:hypothetical protein
LDEWQFFDPALLWNLKKAAIGEWLVLVNSNGRKPVTVNT